MNLLYFGSAGRQLFGAYHAPGTATAGRGAALLCPPWGPEYFVSHGIFRRLAVRLSNVGYHVLRFDYYGTGDSAGERHDGDLATWQDDGSAAIDELKDISGEAAVVVVGVRLGAVIGWRLAVSRPEVRSLVMWDPVISGSDYLLELKASQAEIDRWSLGRRPIGQSADGGEELLGMPLPPAMRSTIGAITPAEYRLPTAARVSIFYSDDLEGKDTLHGALQAGGTPFHAETMTGQTPWRVDESIGTRQVPLSVLERMVEVLH
jgi:pimeloyl-ACP methyl ester carboxylesterase